MTGLKRYAYRALRATSLVLVVKGAVAGGVTALALFGISVPHLSDALGVSPDAIEEGWAAAVGAALGAAAAIRA